MPKKKNPPDKGRLGNLVLIDKQRLSRKLSEIPPDVNTKADVEATMDIFFEQMGRK